MPASVLVRPAVDRELPAVADLRWRWLQENGAEDGAEDEAEDGARDGAAPDPAQRAGFVRHFTSWAARHRETHRCWVAVRRSAADSAGVSGPVGPPESADPSVLLGMAWLALLPRVPTPHAPERYSGDVQCVYVVPAERDAGVGGLLLAEVLREAAEHGVERVTVHSSTRAVPAYSRWGFTASPRLLQVYLSGASQAPSAPRVVERSRQR